MSCQVCVIGIKDEYSGELPKAYVVLTAAAAKKSAVDKAAAVEQIASIKKFVSDKLVRYKWLDGGVEFIECVSLALNVRI
jgi:4-coumarate--CoA ligase